VCCQCGEFGYYNRKCTTCYVGEYLDPLPEDHYLGQCEGCLSIGAIGNHCEECGGGTFIYDSFDMNLIHLDLHANYEAAFE
jgi:hypothetical protein